MTDPSSDTLGLVPTPARMTTKPGAYTLPSRVTASGPADWVDAIERILFPGSGIRCIPAESGAALTVTEDSALAEGAYRLVVNDEGVALSATGLPGVVNAVATLRQLLPSWACGLAPIAGRELTLPHVEIDDAPRFGWRGLHLDVGRHFQPLDSLFRFVDLMHLHKLNRFHLHLTEDQGWRFEVLKYPRLTTVGAVRPETVYPSWDGGDGTPHGGFYTQDQLRSLVAYAAERGITIVPEIDVPGHVRSLLAAYPEYGEDLTGEGFTVPTGFGVFNEVLHLTDETVAMVEDIFTELIDVFPSTEIHIGGDECPKEQWKASDAAAKLAADRGLENVELLQRWFTAHLRDWLAERGRRLVGWDEIIDEAEVPDAVVMSWRGTAPGKKALAQGNEVVMAPYDCTYFDYYQSTDASEPYAIGGYAPWENVLAYDPLADIPAEHHDRMLGVQAQLWTEYMPTAAHVQYMTYPRAVALAEVAWAGTPMSADDFRATVDGIHGARLDASGVNYRPMDGALPWQMGGTGRLRRPQGHGE